MIVNIDFVKEEEPIEKIKEKLNELTQDYKNKENKIKIKNIISSVFCDAFELEPVDFNGWQCDWWDSFVFNGHNYEVFGCAWEGIVEITIE